MQEYLFEELCGLWKIAVSRERCMHKRKKRLSQNHKIHTLITQRAL